MDIDSRALSACIYQPVIKDREQDTESHGQLGQDVVCRISSVEERHVLAAPCHSAQITELGYLQLALSAPLKFPLLHARLLPQCFGNTVK